MTRCAGVVVALAALLAATIGSALAAPRAAAPFSFELNLASGTFVAAPQPVHEVSYAGTDVIVAGRNIPLPDPVWAVEPSPDGRRVAAVTFDSSVCASAPPPCGTFALWMMNRDGSGLRLFSADATDPAWSPDSRRLAFVGRYDTPTLSGIVSVANIDGARRRELDKRQQVVRPRWSTDASLLAYTLPSGHSSVRVVRVSDGRRVAALTRAAGPAWGRGRQLAFIRHLDNREVLALWDKGHMRVLATSAAGITTPTWSPDGRKLAFATSGAAAAIGVVRADRGRARMFGLPTAGSHTGTDVTDIIWEGGGKLVVAGRHYGIPGPALGGWRGACGVRLSTV